jgi:hypothetical protein
MTIRNVLLTTNSNPSSTNNLRKGAFYSDNSHRSDRTVISSETPDYSNKVQPFKLDLSNEEYLLNPGSLYTIGRGISTPEPSYITVSNGLRSSSGISRQQVTAILAGTNKNPYLQIEHVPNASNKSRVQVSLSDSTEFRSFDPTVLPKLAVGDRIKFAPIELPQITYALTIRPKFIDPFGLTEQMLNEKQRAIEESEKGQLAIQQGQISSTPFAKKYAEFIEVLSGGDITPYSENLIGDIEARVATLLSLRDQPDSIDPLYTWTNGLTQMFRGLQSTAVRSLYKAKREAEKSESQDHKEAATRMNFDFYLTRVR